MTRKKYTAADVHYNKGDEYLQSLLRVALFENWEGRCHWCGSGLRNPVFAEIDHIIPETKFIDFKGALEDDNNSIYSEQFRQRLTLLLPASPHVVENLAPICRRHNQTKSATIDGTTLGAISNSLKKARAKSSSVTSRVIEMTSAVGLSASLIDLIALPKNRETQALLERWGPAVVGSLWRFDKQLLEDFRVPREIDLKLDVGVNPDWMHDATRTGSGIDGGLNLTLDQRAALEGAAVLYEFDDIGAALSRAIESAVNDADAKIERDLKREGVEHVDSVEPRWVSIVATELKTGGEPHLIVTVQMSAALGGEAILDTTDADGGAIIVSRWRRFESQIICDTDFVSAMFEVSIKVKTLEDNFDEDIEWRQDDDGVM